MNIEPLHEDPSLPEELRDALRAYRQIEPDARMREALLGSVERKAKTPSLLRVLLGLVVLGAVLVLWPVAKPAAPVPLHAAERAVEPAVVPAIVEVEPTVTPEAQVASEPIKTPKPRRPRATPPEVAPAPDLAGELSLLARGKRTLAADPARALALTVEHADRFPQGALAEEREVIAIEALARSGRRQAAEERAAQFQATHPRSTHLARLEVVLAAP